MDFGIKVVLVVRQVRHNFHQLAGYAPTQTANQRERKNQHYQNSGYPPNT
jgi:hypothetical protein